MDFKTINQDNSDQDQDINIIQEITDSHPTPLQLTNPSSLTSTVTTILTTTTTTKQGQQEQLRKKKKQLQ